MKCLPIVGQLSSNSTFIDVVTTGQGTTTSTRTQIMNERYNSSYMVK